MSKNLNDIAHEIWASAQLHPNEGIEDGIHRIKKILKEREPYKVFIDMSGGLPHEIVSEVDLDVVVVDFDDDEGDTKVIDGREGYVFEGVVADVDPKRVRKVFKSVEYG